MEENIDQSSYVYQDAFLKCLLKWKMENLHQNSEIDLINILYDINQVSFRIFLTKGRLE